MDDRMKALELAVNCGFFTSAEAIVYAADIFLAYLEADEV